MTLGTIIERMADDVELKVRVGTINRFARVYDFDKDFSNVFDYLNCEVTIIDTSEDGTLIVTVDDSEE